MNANKDPQNATKKCAYLVGGKTFTRMEMVHMAGMHFIVNVI